MASKKHKRPTPPPPPVRSAPPRAKSPTGSTSKRAAAEQAARRDALRRRLVAAGVVVAGVAAVGTYVVVDRRGDQAVEQVLTSGTCTVDSRTDPTSGAPNNHVPSPTYAVDPPAGGNHLGASASAGAYAGTAVPSDGLLVHSLEHGYVVVWHQPGLDAAAKQALVDLQERNDPDVILVERASVPGQVAATAWGERLLCGQSEPEAVQRFVDEHVGNGPEDVGRI